MDIAPGALRRKFGVAWPHLDERARRVMAAAAEAMSLGWRHVGGGTGVWAVAQSNPQAIAELCSAGPLVVRTRCPGADRKPLAESNAPAAGAGRIAQFQRHADIVAQLLRSR
jgi:hypothetical protein